MTIKELTLKAKEYDEEAVLALADAYWNGKGVKKSKTKAKELLEDGASHGLGECAYRLANIYERGVTVYQNFDIARTYYMMGARSHHIKCLEKMADYYEQGLSVVKDLEESRKFREEAESLKVM